MYETICIFTSTGNTFTFKNIKITCNNERMLCFEYKAMSDGKVKTMNVIKSNIVGFSVTANE